MLRTASYLLACCRGNTGRAALVALLAALMLASAIARLREQQQRLAQAKAASDAVAAMTPIAWQAPPTAPRRSLPGSGRVAGLPRLERAGPYRRSGRRGDRRPDRRPCVRRQQGRPPRFVLPRMCIFPCPASARRTRGGPPWRWDGSSAGKVRTERRLATSAEASRNGELSGRMWSLENR